VGRQLAVRSRHSAVLGWQHKAVEVGVGRKSKIKWQKANGKIQMGYNLPFEVFF
jgi:hypothetical protein